MTLVTINHAKNMNIKNKTLIFLFSIKALIALILCFDYFNGPHVIRQIDTMSVSLRYWLDFSSMSFLKALVPKILSAGDKVAIAPMEFPILNIFLSPFFGLDLSVGRSLARVGMLTLVISLVVVNYRVFKNISAQGINLSKVILILPLYSISSMYLDKFMPDFISFLLITLSVGLAIKERNKKPWLYCIFASIGLLIKPPMAIGFAPLLLKDYKSILISSIIKWIIPSICICLFYYVYVIGLIKEMSAFSVYFDVELRDPLDAMMGFFAEPRLIFNLIAKDLFTAYSVIPIIFWSVWMKVKHQEKTVPLTFWGVLALQIFSGALLDGKHIFHHSYYLIACSFFCSLIFYSFMERGPKPLVLVVVLAVGIHQVEKLTRSLRSINSNHLFSQCDEIRSNLRIGEKIRTVYSPYPTLGLCLGAVQNSETAELGVYQKKLDSIPDNGEQVYETSDLIVLRFKN